MAAGIERAGRHHVHQRLLIGRRGAVATLAAAAVALVGYVWTLHPGLAGGDSAEFQYVSRLLVPAHSPGYPVYVGLLFVWSYLVPIGSLALRANLLSACCAAATVAVVVRLALRLGCSPLLAALSALGLAFGGVFWSQALVAEVYALGALLVAGVLLKTLSCGGADDRSRQVFAVGGLLALEWAHQPAVAFLVAPAIGAYILLLRGLGGWRRLAGVAAVSLAGLLPYGFVVAHYLAHGESLARGVSVVSASSFHTYFMPFSLAHFVTNRIPLVARLVAADLGPLGVLACCVGLAALARGRRWAEMALLGGAATSVFLFAASYNVPDVDVFTMPVFVILWPMAGIGFSAVSRTRWRWGRWVVTALALATPVWQCARHYRTVDQSANMRDTRYFEALMQVLPPGAVIAPLEFPLEPMLAYTAHGEGRRPDVRSIFPDMIEGSVSSGRPTFIMTNTVEPPAGIETTDVPVFAESIEEFLERRSTGEIVFFCGRSRGLDRAQWVRVLRALGAESLPDPGENAIVVGELGAKGALVRTGDRVELALEAGDSVGPGRTRLAKRLRVVSDSAGTRIEWAGRVVVNRDGRIVARIRRDARVKAYAVSDDLRVATGYRLLRVTRVAAHVPRRSRRSHAIGVQHDRAARDEPLDGVDATRRPIELVE